MKRPAGSETVEDIIDKKEFMHLLWRYKHGSITRRHFLGASGLGLATAVLAQAMPGLVAPKRAHAAGELGDRLSVATWPNYYDPANYEKFTADTGVQIDVAVFGSNEEMLAKLQAGGTGWDVFVPTNYTISTYVKLGPSSRSTFKQAAEFRHRAQMIHDSSSRARWTARCMRCRRIGEPPDYAVNTKSKPRQDDHLEAVLGPLPHQVQRRA